MTAALRPPTLRTVLLLRTLPELAETARRLGRDAGLGGVLVPTMGALHAGHAALIAAAAQLATSRGLPTGCVVSIFVNPTQFNEAADFDRYPRTLDADLDVCERAGASIVFAPEPEAMYPPTDPAAAPVPPLPEVATRPGLEDAHRPGHFAGVCQVVLRLFRLLGPDAAIFGEKDWQQLQVVRAMVAQQGLPIEIVGHPTIREADGLALSSRNRFLAQDHRAAALALSRALARAAEQAEPASAERAMRDQLSRSGVLDATEYAVVRDAATLQEWRPGRPGRALIAARVGAVRLIDNAPWGPRDGD